MNKILITGASGFAGTYLAEYLNSLKRYKIYGTYHRDEEFHKSPIKEFVNFEKINLLDENGVSDMIERIMPNGVIHLAAASSVQDSFLNPAQTFQNNVTSQINLLEAMRKSGLTNSKVLIISSCEVYGFIDKKDLPVDENTRFRPITPYAVSKIAQDYLALQYYLSYKLQCVRVRPFNHIGPRQSPKFIASDFAKQIAEIEKGKQKPVINVGNLESKRDFTDVRDIVRAYHALYEKGIPGEAYNVGSGQSRSAGEILEILLTLTKIKISISIDKNKQRTSDMPDIVCDNKKLVQLTGWNQKINLKQTLQDTLDYWRMMV